MIMIVRAVMGAALAGALALGALLGLDRISGPAAPAPVAPGDQASRSVPDSEPAASSSPTRFDRFIAPDGGENLASAANSACGFPESLNAGGTLLRIAGEPETGVGVYQAEAGDGGVLRSFTASAGAVQAFADGGSLYIQTGHEDRDGLNSRVFVLDEEGFPTFSEPLMVRGRIALSCADPEAAADLLNEAFARSGGGAGGLRAGVRAFEIGDGVEAWFHPRVDAFTTACTSDETLAELPAGELFVLKTEFDADAVFGETVEHYMSGESLAGSPEPMVYVTLAEIDDQAGFANIHKYRIPLSWSFMPLDESRVSPVFRFDAIEGRSWMIGPDGARGHGMGGDNAEGVGLPCRDPAAGAAALEAVRDDHRAR